MRYICSKLIILSLVFACISTTISSQTIFYSPTTDNGIVSITRESTRAGANMKIRINPAALKSLTNNALVIKIPVFGFPDGKEILVNKKKQEEQPNQFAWYGEVQGQAGSFVLFTLVGKAVAGYI